MVSAIGLSAEGCKFDSWLRHDFSLTFSPQRGKGNDIISQCLCWGLRNTWGARCGFNARFLLLALQPRCNQICFTSLPTLSLSGTRSCTYMDDIKSKTALSIGQWYILAKATLSHLLSVYIYIQLHPATAVILSNQSTGNLHPFHNTQSNHIHSMHSKTVTFHALYSAALQLTCPFKSLSFPMWPIFLVFLCLLFFSSSFFFNHTIIQASVGLSIVIWVMHIRYNHLNPL